MGQLKSDSYMVYDVGSCTPNVHFFPHAEGKIL